MTRVETSLSSPLQIATIHRLGKIGLTICPGKKGLSQNKEIDWQRDLKVDIKAIKKWGATHVISLLEDEEFRLLKVPLLPDYVENENMVWHELPIVDGCAPSERFNGLWPTLRNTLIKNIKENKEGVVIHCRGGLGRSGLFASILLKELYPSIPIKLIMEHIRFARPGAIETKEQEAWLYRQYPESLIDLANYMFSNEINTFLSQSESIFENEKSSFFFSSYDSFELFVDEILSQNNKTMNNAWLSFNKKQKTYVKQKLFLNFMRMPEKPIDQAFKEKAQERKNTKKSNNVVSLFKK